MVVSMDTNQVHVISSDVFEDGQWVKLAEKAHREGGVSVTRYCTAGILA